MNIRCVDHGCLLGPRAHCHLWAFFVHSCRWFCLRVLNAPFAYLTLMPVASIETMYSAVAILTASACTVVVQPYVATSACLLDTALLVCLGGLLQFMFAWCLQTWQEKTREREPEKRRTLPYAATATGHRSARCHTGRKPVFLLLSNHSGLALPLLFLSSSTFLLSSSKPLMRSFASSFFFSRT